MNVQRQSRTRRTGGPFRPSILWGLKGPGRLNPIDRRDYSAEGCGKSSPKDRRRYFHTSRASAYEVAAILDVAERFGVLGKGYHTEGKDICDHLAAMLSNFR